MRSSVEEKVLKLLRKTVEKEVRKLDVAQDWPDWPPSYGIILHQPKRPQQNIGSKSQQ